MYPLYPGILGYVYRDLFGIWIFKIGINPQGPAFAGMTFPAFAGMTLVL